MELIEFVHSPAVTCTEDTSLADAARRMESYNIGSIVVEKDGQITGIVTDRDLALRGVAKERAPETPVAEIMTRSVVSLQEDADVFDAARQMASAGCRRLPVIGTDGALKGVVALDELMLLFTRHADNLAAAISSEIARP